MMGNQQPSRFSNDRKVQRLGDTDQCIIGLGTPTSARTTMSLEHDIAWLAGIIDGEGSVTIAHCADKKKPGKRSYAPRIEMFNTNHELLNKVSRIVRALGASCNDHMIGAGKTGPLSRKPVRRITVTSIQGVLLIGRAVVEHLTEKRAAIEFVISHWSPRLKGSKWTDDEVNRVLEFRSRKR